MSDAPCIPLLRGRASHFNTRLCVGLDPVMERLPEALDGVPDPILTFCRVVVDATAEVALAYKPNAAFFEADGAEGWERLQALISYIPAEIPVILDAKRGDIGSSSQGYARMAFEAVGADAVTVNPYMGRDSLQPFLDYEERGVFILAATSNTGAEDFQALEVDGQPLPVHVARAARRWNEHGNIGLVAGATRPGMLAVLRREAPDLTFLVPGVGAQGGDVKRVMAAAVDEEGEGVIVTASRSILYTDDPDFERGSARAARKMVEEINRAREEALDARS
ncbi:MAG: orotidine-5'-phosphate decarboxylase [bacterium]